MLLLQRRPSAARERLLAVFSLASTARNGMPSVAETCNRLGRFRSMSSARPQTEEYLVDNHDLDPAPLRTRFSKRQPSPLRQRSMPAPIPLAKKAQEICSVVEYEQQTFTDAVKSGNGLQTPMDSVHATLSDRVSPTTFLKYTGEAVIPITSVLDIIKPQDDAPRGVWPVFRLMVCVCITGMVYTVPVVLTLTSFTLFTRTRMATFATPRGMVQNAVTPHPTLLHMTSCSKSEVTVRMMMS